MKTVDEIEVLAKERLEEANILCTNEKYAGAFYLAGYSIELMLKAKICKHFDIDNLFDEQCSIYGVSQVRKALKTHDIAVLLIFSGLQSKLEEAKSHSRVLMQTYSRLFEASGHCIWSEQLRYTLVDTPAPEDILTLMILLGHEEGLLKWIKQN